MTTLKRQDDELTQEEALAALASQVIEFVTLEDLQKQSLSLDDLFGFQESILEQNKNQNIDEQLYDATHLFEHMPTSSDEGPHKQGFQHIKAIQHNPLALHYAAKKGDMDEIKRLVEKQGYNVNKDEGVLSARPLYFASFFGQKAAVQYLLKQGADVHDDSYTGQTALHGAIYRHHYDVARILVNEGNALANLPNMDNKTPIMMIHERLLEVMKSPVQDRHEINELIETLDVISNHFTNHVSYQLPSASKEGIHSISTYLKLFAHIAPSSDIKARLDGLSKKIAAFNPKKEIEFTESDILALLHEDQSKPMKSSFSLSQAALHEALDNQQYEIARQIVIKGGAKPNIFTNNELPLNTVIIRLNHLMSEKVQVNQAAKVKEIYELIHTIDVFSAHTGKYCHFIVSNDAHGTIAKPVSMYLKLFATRSPTIEMRDKFLAVAKKIEAFDNTEKLYANAKNLLNTFPSDGFYKLNLSDNKTILVQGNGHFGFMTTHWAAESIKAFTTYLHSHSNDKLKQDIFTKLSSIFEATDHLKSNAEIEQYSQDTLKSFQRNETVLLATGWDTHFYDAVLSQKQKLYITGNTGERYFNHAPGLICYQMNEPKLIDAKFIHDTTTNQNQMVLEQDKMLEYELIEKVGEHLKPEQEFGNCTWLGHSHGVQAAAYVELLNLGIEEPQAKSLASHYTQEWENFHANFQIDQYMKDGAGLSVEAMTAILINLNVKAVKEHSPVVKQQAQKIADALDTHHYKGELQAWLEACPKKQCDAIKNIIEQYGVKVDIHPHHEEPSQGFFSIFTKPFAKLFGHSDPVSDQAQVQHDDSASLVSQHPAININIVPQLITESHEQLLVM
ncbi:MAG: ankyrin repeat domain-containing protein [Gammaproteobacteria bacterium]|jgi:ankyrin repeat protein|nr:ankyrin repeat domain-containing protein [Gammaproteobacteria bacterium]